MATNDLNFNNPYLVGWQYSRPDDQRGIYPSERQSPGIADLDMYIHRRRLLIDTQNPLPRYRKSFDIYSLGIVLIEIAFWEPILSLASDNDRDKMQKWEDVQSSSLAGSWWEAIERTARKELASEMGEAYRDAVMFCIEGSGKRDEETFEDRKKKYLKRIQKKTVDRPKPNGWYKDDDFEEVGIEREFYWRVLKALESFGM